MSQHSFLSVAVLVSLVSGCAITATDEHVGEARDDLGFSVQDASIMLAFVNYPATDFAVLDVPVGLDRRAANAIITHRNGVDGQCPSDDDAPIESLEELDSLAYVGTSALQKIATYAAMHPAPQPELVEGVELAGWQSEAVIWGVNQASLQELDDVVALDVRAAGNLFANAPFESVTAMGPMGYVGNSALKKLRSYATIWAAKMLGNSAAGNYDGVYFDTDAADVALTIANTATAYQMKLGGGMWITSGHTVVEARPYASLAEVAATKGVGKSTMRALQEFATSDQWPWSGVCAASVAPGNEPAVTQYDAGLDAYEPYSYAAHDLRAWSVPTCASIDDPDMLDALQAKVITLAGWDYIVAQWPENLEDDAVHVSTKEFQSMLDNSLDRAKNWRDIKVADGVPNAAAEYDALAAHKATIDALVSANPDSNFAFTIHLEALECSHDATVFVDFASGIAIGIRQPTSC